MKPPTKARKRLPFPKHLPPIAIRPSRARPFAVACRELLWWFAVPKVGDRTLWASYDPPAWTLTGVTEMRATRPAVIHGVAGAAIEVAELTAREDLSDGVCGMCGRLTEETAEYLAVASMDDGTLRLRTFRDEGFEEDWGREQRRFEDRGRFAQQDDGTFRQTSDDPAALGAGVFRVHVGEQRFTCLRVFYLDGPLSGPRTTLLEAYLTRNGRTILQRHYCQPSRRGQASQQRPPLTIDGVKLLPWYDCLGHLAIGMKP